MIKGVSNMDGSLHIVFKKGVLLCVFFFFLPSLNEATSFLCLHLQAHANS